MPEFELNKPDWFETDFVLEAGFDPDPHNNVWYSVKFKGDATEHLWLAKTKPEQNKSYYGHFELTKSGKKWRFKRDKEPEDEPKPSNTPSKADKKPDAFLRDATTVPIDMIKALLPYFDVQTLKPNSEQYRTLMELAQNLTEDALTMVESIRSGEKIDKVIDEVPDKITLDDVEDI